MTYSLFKKLDKFYGKIIPWKEVIKVYEELGEELDESETKKPFKNLIMTVLTQNTSETNSARAWVGLKRRFKITPQELATARVTSISAAIKAGGLHNTKARRIKELAKNVMREYDGDLGRVLKLSKEEMRKALLNMKGVGEKTADVFMMSCAGADVAPVDTNIKRVAKRLGLVREGATYSEVQKAIEKIIPPGKRKRGHELLIRLGRDYCKALRPDHKHCPVKNLCPTWEKSAGNHPGFPD